MNINISFFGAALGLVFSLGQAFAGSATWLSAPGSGDWNSAGNWTPGGPPNGGADSARFEFSTVNTLSISTNTRVNNIEFVTSAPAYTITADQSLALTISGVGITNNSGTTQNFVAAADNGMMRFVNSATAGFDTAFITNGGAVSDGAFGVTEFRDNSNAGNASFTTNSGTVSGAFGGVTRFLDRSSAGDGTFTTNGRTVIDAGSGVTLFFDNSTAGAAAFTTNGGVVPGAFGGFLVFFDHSSAANGTFTTNGGRAVLTPGGVTQFFDQSTAANGVFTINGGVVPKNGLGGVMQFFDRSTAANGKFTINGGAAEGEGGGTMEFHDRSTAGNGTFTTNGITANFAAPGQTLFFDHASAGSGTFTTNGGGNNGAAGGGHTTFFDHSSAGNGTFTTNGAPVSDGAGAVTEFRLNATADNGTFVVNGSAFPEFVCPAEICSEQPQRYGVLFFAENATAANATIVANGGIGEGAGGLINFESDSTGGTARVEVFGNARLDISGQSDRGFTIGSIEGTGAVFLGASELRVGSNDLSTTFSGVIQEGGIQGTTGGSLTKIGAGTLTLAGDNTYVGNTRIDRGALLVDGSVASRNSFVRAAALLGGTGFIGGNVMNSGITSPGDASAGTLTLAGRYTQNTGGALQIEIGGVRLAQHDLLQVNGMAQLDGTLQLARVSNFHFLPGDKITFLTTAGGASGTFSTVANPFNDTIVLTELVYEADRVSLEASQGSFASLSGLTSNQRAVADQLDSIITDPRGNELIALLDTELLGNLPRDYDLIAPEELASIYEIGFSHATVQALNLQRRTDAIRNGSTGFSGEGLTMGGSKEAARSSDGEAVLEEKATPVFSTSPENRWGVFVTGTGEFTDVGDQDSNARGYDIATGGLTLGADFRVNQNFAVGVNAGYAHSSADLTENGRVTVEGGNIGAYATYFTGGFYLDAAAGGGWNSYDERRTALPGTARGKTNGSEFNALLGTGYDWKKGNWTFGPTATFEYSNVEINKFTETGSPAALEIPDQSEDALRSTLGLKLSYDWKTCGVIVRPEVRAAWEHEFGDRSYPIDARFASGAGDSFTTRGPQTGRDSARISAGLAVQWNARLSTYVYGETETGRSNRDSQSVNGGLRVGF